MTKTVLVVDDDPTQRRLIQAVLEREGFAVSQAEDGDAALRHLTSGQPADVVLLDLQMPGLNGQDTLKEMRARGLAQPVIVVTAGGGVETVVKAMQAGAQDFFVKPASPERIIVSIRNALSMGEMRTGAPSTTTTSAIARPTSGASRRSTSPATAHAAIATGTSGSSGASTT